MRFFTDSLLVSLGAVLGANARYWLGYAARANSQAFPWPTLTINVLGSLLLGFFSAAALSRGWLDQSRLFFAVGVLGSFTTFSTFSFEVVDLVYRRSWKLAAAYAALNLVLAVGSCFLGAHYGRVWFERS